MGSASIDVIPYNGALLAANLLSSVQNIVLADFGTQLSGTITDTDGILGPGDDGIATFQGNPISYVGSGTATPGVFVPGVGTVPLGTTVDLVVFEAGGQIYFHYPAGDLDLTGAIAVVVDIDPTPYPIFSPACFVADTMIATPDGERRAIDLRPGDRVRDIHGRDHAILWTSQRHVALSSCGSETRATLAPVTLPPALTGGDGGRSLSVSRNHLILMQHAALQLHFGLDQALVPAGAFAGFGGTTDLSARAVTYVHIMCDSHVILRANGTAAETFFPGPQAMAALGPLQRRDFHADPRRTALVARMRHAAAVLTMQEARFLLAEISQAEMPDLAA
ncbi:Hint domain-containing protein [Pseudooceanicola nitratireducens]|jgi:hypothetical protein|uniref:Hint domain-containing protein n=1 Tax=Pseudooceanicola nitratireducens TaxID=517719 RepID=UPI001C93D376|nr:Hint domain-containing protein [Pseudooceanicola nitratireducens]MBY6164655.1 Hint domain-containing protein [Pseudooceanicola nitratireducens]|eukprot:g15425.t1